MVREKQSDVVWRYGNRKLYDTRKSQYVNFENLKDYVVAGASFAVRNRTTGDDETCAVLCQVLHHQMRNGAQLQADQIRTLIRAAETSTQEKSDGVAILESTIEAG